MNISNQDQKQHMSKRFFWLVFSLALLILNIYCLRINLNADSLFPYRYAHSLLEYQTSQLVVQPGTRIFPEWIYGLAGYLVTTDMTLWSRVVILINTLVLGFSLVFFFTTLGFGRKQTLLYTSIFLLTLPILNLLHLNVLIYLVFSPGIHGFMIPYVIICMALLFRWLVHNRLEVFSAVVFIAICGLVMSSNINFIVMFFAPASFVCAYIFIGSPSQRFLVGKIFVVFTFSLITGLLLIQLINAGLEPMILLKNEFRFFQQSLSDWVSGNELFTEMISRNRSGYFLYALILSTVLSGWVIVTKRHQMMKPIYLLNLFVVSVFPIFMFVAWSIEKNLLRLMPHVIFFSQGLLFVNLAHLFRNKVNFHVLSLAVLLAGLTATIKYYTDKSPYIQHHNVISFLDELRQKGEIKGDGLSDYWIANVILDDSYALLPIHFNGLPMLYAVDANMFWTAGGAERKLDHVVNTKTRNAETWILNEELLTKTYGEWSHMKKFELKNRLYRVYIYSDGIDVSRFYQSIDSELQRLRLKY